MKLPKFESGFTHVALAIFVAVLIAVTAGVVTLRSNNTRSTSNPEAKFTHTNQGNSNGCQSNPQPIFTHDITDLPKITSIFPPAHIIGGELKTRAYIHVNGNVPVYAPTDMTLTDGSFHTSLDGNAQYSLYFQVSCEVKVLFDHISSPIDSIKKVLPATPSKDSRTTPVVSPISFKAGDLVGYSTGTSVGKAWDFAVFNSTKPNYFSKIPQYNNSWVNTTADCPFYYFSKEKQAVYFALFKNDMGVQSTPVELCKTGN